MRAPRALVDAPGYPWGDRELSRRMLALQLCPDDIFGSRPLDVIRQEVAWISEAVGLGAGARVLDVACGPGLYSLEFARRGCRVTGVDIAPVPIEYARHTAREEGLACAFLVDEMRQLSWESEFETVIMVSGVFNHLNAADAEGCMAAVARALCPGGAFVCESTTYAADPGPLYASWWFLRESGLFSDEPYLHLQEKFRDPDAHTVVDRHFVIDRAGHLSEVTHSSRAYSREELAALASRAGLAPWAFYSSLAGTPYAPDAEWLVMLARKALPVDGAEPLTGT